MPSADPGDHDRKTDTTVDKLAAVHHVVSCTLPDLRDHGLACGAVLVDLRVERDPHAGRSGGRRVPCRLDRGKMETRPHAGLNALALALLVVTAESSSPLTV